MNAAELIWEKARAVFLLALLITSPALAQRKVTISGHITDNASGETLIGAGILERESGVGAVTNNFGYYTLTLPAGEYDFHYSYVGYSESVLHINMHQDTVVNVALMAGETLSSSHIVARKDAGIQSTYLGAIDIPAAQIKNTPVLFGEADVLKVLQMMPGVQGGNEGFSGIYVRGGGPDENLIMLDGVPIYNVDHMLGIFSVFQPEAVKKVTLYKGSFPARYGGRVSSIVDIRTNDGNMKENHGTVSIGLISDKLHLEGPIIKDKLAYSVSARGMHTLLYAPVIKLALNDAYGNYYFYDLNGKLTWRLSDRDRFYFGAYHGRDHFVYWEDDESEGTSTIGKETSHYKYKDRTDVGVFWGNTVGSARWNHVFNSKLFANTTVSYNRYRMVMNAGSAETEIVDGVKSTNRYHLNYHSGIRDFGIRTDMDYTPSPRHLVKFGSEYIWHTFIPERMSAVDKEVTGGEVQVDTTFHFADPKKRYGGHELSFYAEDDFNIGEHITVNPGVHLSMFNTEGRTYWSLQPRVSAKYSTGSGLSFKAGYARMAQYVHLLSSAQISLPVDLWVPITKDIRPVTSDQYSIGTYYDGVKGWEFSVEGYLKNMRNILEYKDGTLMLGTSDGWENRVEMGEGTAKGIEFLIQKTAGNTTGWLAYTLAKSDRIFPDGSINNGERFPYKYDRRHSIDLSLDHRFNEKWGIDATWSFATGGTTTVPVRQVAVMTPYGYITDAQYVDHRNNFRIPPSHRLNIGCSLHNERRWGESVWNFSVYNAYNRMNPNFVFTDYGPDYDKNGNYIGTSLKMKKITILPLLPSVSWTLNF
ncbi:MAG: TonB-dependent receptor [Bacteroidales bacterium]|nr:TonB-dependent receptor [Bacteroidales bacterium]